MTEERILDVMPTEPGRRLVASVRRSEPGSSRGGQELVLRQESLSDAGWFTQSEITVEAGQIAGLKLLLSGDVGKQLLANQNCGPAPETIPIDRFLAKRA